MKNLDVELTGTFLKSCDGCSRAKAKAKAVPKVTSVEAAAPGERFFLDTTGPFKPSVGGTMYDIKLVEQFSRKTWGVRVKKKSMVPSIMEKHFEVLKGRKIDAKFLQCDNAGEHQDKLRAVCKKYGVMLALTASNTPQQNGIVARKIVTVKTRAHAMV